MKLNKQTVTAVISAALLTGGAAFGQSGDAILDLLTKKGVSPFDQVEWERRTAKGVNSHLHKSQYHLSVHRPPSIGMGRCTTLL